MDALRSSKFKELLNKVSGTRLPHGALACGDSRKSHSAVDTELVLANAEATGSASFEEVLAICNRLHELEAEIDFLNASYALDDDANLSEDGLRLARSARALLILKKKNKELADACRFLISEIFMISDISEETRTRVLTTVSSIVSE